MPHGRTSFQASWLEEKDSNGNFLNQWCERGTTDFVFYCKICQKTRNCDNSGLLQVIQHAEGDKHKKMAACTLSALQTRLCFTNQSETGGKKISFHLHSTDVLKAEIVWPFYAAQNNISFRACSSASKLAKKTVELAMLEAEKKKNELLNKKRQSVTKREENLLKEEEETSEKVTSQPLLKEAAQKLQAALIKKDLASISVANIMITAAQKSMESAQKEMQLIRNRQKGVELKKRKLISDLSKEDTTTTGRE